MWHIQRIVLQSISRWFIIFIIAFATLRWCGCAIAHANGNASSSHATVAFTGDVLLDRGVRDAVKCMNVSDLVRDIRIALHRIDIAFCNLECPISERASKLPKPASFRAPPAMLSVLR
ncbi:MAG TPA: hypothetical protein EYP10_07370, partial [Armatimonadetes bacterium]|nr:hypothetical protein [Armatimonadota bacterium]